MLLGPGRQNFVRGSLAYNLYRSVVIAEAISPTVSYEEVCGGNTGHA